MINKFTATLIGPFPMSTPPVREGFYAVANGTDTPREMWCYMDGQWYDSDDGLGSLMDTSQATGWFGANQPGASVENLAATAVEPDDGLGL